MDLIAVEGLLEIVERPELHGFDGRIHAPVRGEQDHRQIRVLLSQRLEQPDAIELWHPQVRDHGVEGARGG